MSSVYSARRALPEAAVVPAPAPASISGASALDLEPELGSGIPPEDWVVARRATPAQLTRIPRGKWISPLRPDGDQILGLIVNEGIVSREVALGRHVAFELLGPGDALLPADAEPLDSALGGREAINALSAARVIVLGTAFARACARWPVLLTNLHRRVEAVRRRQATHGLAAHLPRAEDRLLLTLWLLADTCGRVTSDGIVIPLSLPHQALARLTAAQRPTITLALQNLSAAGFIQRHSRSGLTLTPAASQRVRELTTTNNDAPSLAIHIADHAP
ncbi:MAG TPA: Crp/Fnr family transcriptional regulator [Solirubrobacteraceae bacterium]